MRKGKTKMNWQARDERAENLRKEFAGKIDAVAALLGATVKRDAEKERDDRADVVLPDGVTFWFSLNTYEGRAHVSPRWPRDTAGQDHYRRDDWSITLAPSRPAEAMAKDIQRRFLAKYAPAYAEMKTAADKASGLYAETLEFARDLAKETGMRFHAGPYHSNSDELSQSDLKQDRYVDLGRYGSDRNGYGDLRISATGGYYEIKYHPQTAGEARHIALAIANYRARVNAADRSAPRPADPEMIPAAIEEQPELPALEVQPELGLGAGKNIATLALPEDANPNTLASLLRTSNHDARNSAHFASLASLLAAREIAEKEGRKTLRAILQIEINRRNKQERKAA